MKNHKCSSLRRMCDLIFWHRNVVKICQYSIFPRAPIIVIFFLIISFINCFRYLSSCHAEIIFLGFCIAVTQWFLAFLHFTFLPSTILPKTSSLFDLRDASTSPPSTDISSETCDWCCQTEKKINFASSMSHLLYAINWFGKYKNVIVNC